MHCVQGDFGRKEAMRPVQESLETGKGQKLPRDSNTICAQQRPWVASKKEMSLTRLPKTVNNDRFFVYCSLSTISCLCVFLNKVIRTVSIAFHRRHGISMLL